MQLIYNTADAIAYQSPDALRSVMKTTRKRALLFQNNRVGYLKDITEIHPLTWVPLPRIELSRLEY